MTGGEILLENACYQDVYALLNKLRNAGATIDYCLAYAIFGFRMFVRGCIDKKAEKIDAQNQTADLEPQQQDKPKQKNYRWFDLVVGIYQILVLVATIAIGIILL